MPNRIAMLHQKRILVAGSPSQVQHHPHEYVQSFMRASLVGREDTQ